MALNWQGLGFLFTAKDMASAVIQRIERSLGTLGPTAMRAGKAMGVAFVAAGAFRQGMDVLKGAFAMAESAGEFQSKLGLLNATAEATQEEMKAFKARAIEIGLSTMHGPTAAVQGMTALVSGGFKAAQAMGMVGTALDVVTASAGQLSSSDVAGFLAATMKSFPTEKDANRIANIATMLANVSTTEFRDLPAMYAKVTRGSSAMKQSLVDTSVALALFKNVTPSAEEAATSLGMAMLGLAKPKTKALFEEMTGVKVFDRAKNSWKPFAEIMAELAESPLWQKLGADQQAGVMQKVFESRQMGKVAGAVNQIREGFEGVNGEILKGVAGVRKLAEEFDQATQRGVLERFKREQINTFSGMMKELKARSETIDVLAGGAFANVFAFVIAGLNKALALVGEFFAAIPEQIRDFAAGFFVVAVGIATATAGIAALTAALVFAGIIISSYAAIIIGVFLPAIAVALALTAALVGSIVLVGAAIKAAFATNAGGFRTSMVSFLEKARLGFQVLGQLFEKGGTWGDVHKAIMKPENERLREFLQNVWLWINRIKVFGSSMWDGFQAAIKRMDGPISALRFSFERLLGLFGISLDSAQKNEDEFERWARAGRELGEVLAFLANTAIVLLVYAIEFLIIAAKAVGPAVKDGLRYALVAISMFADLVNARWTRLFWRMGQHAINTLKLLTYIPGMGTTGLRENLENAQRIMDATMKTDELMVQNRTQLDMAKFMEGLRNGGPTPAAAAQNAQLQSLATPVAPPAASPNITVNPTIPLHVQVGPQTILDVVMSAMSETQYRQMSSLATPTGLER